MKAVLQTKFMGYAPAQRGLHNPPELVYQCSEPPRKPLNLRLLLVDLVSYPLMLWVLCRIALYQGWLG